MLFAMAGVLYPGDKWLRREILGLDVPRELKELLDKAVRCGTSDEDLKESDKALMGFFEIVRPRIEEICQDTG